LLLSASLAFGTTLYVSPDGNNIPPFASWENAATNIQYAVNLALDGDEVLVGPGFYLGEANENSGSMITITNAIILRGVSGAAATTVDAAGWHKRCLYVGNTGAFIYGFTFSLGFARTNQGAQTFPISVGGGVFFDGGGTVENCILKFNRAGLAGGNAYFNGGGRMINCLVFEGAAPLCGGLYCDGGGEIINCTIVDNWTATTNLPGGVWCVNGGTVVNSILYRNPSAVGDAEGVYTEGSGWSFDFSRLSAILPGDGNITNDPLFVSFDGDNYRLQAGSPCTDIGTNMTWMADSVDLDGTPRIQRGRVDMGAYEIQATAGDLDADGMNDQWEIDYLGSTNASPTAHGDSDIFNNLDEYIAGTDPTNGVLYFMIADSEPDPASGGFIIQWTSVSNREYSVHWGTNLMSGLNVLTNQLGYPQNSYTDTVHDAESTGFYRIDVQLAE